MACAHFLFRHLHPRPLTCGLMNTLTFPLDLSKAPNVDECFDTNTKCVRIILFCCHTHTQAEYLKNNLKVKSQRAVKGKLGEEVKISGDAGVVTVTVENGAAPKRQLKYLARRYIKKQALNNYVRVVAPTKDSYQIRYLAANEQADEEAGEDVE